MRKYKIIPDVKGSDKTFRIQYGEYNNPENSLEIPNVDVNDFELMNLVFSRAKAKIKKDCGVPQDWFEEILKADQYHDLTEVMDSLPKHKKDKKPKKEPRKKKLEVEKK